MSKTKAGSKPAQVTRAKPAGKTKAAKPATKQPNKKAAATSRAKKPALARKPLPQVEVQACRFSSEKPNQANTGKRRTKTPLKKQPSAATNRIYPISLYDVQTPAQASAMYGGLEKGEARRVRKQFYAAGRRDLAAALRTLS